MKRLFKFIGGLIVTILVICLILVGTLVFCLFDKTNKTPDIIVNDESTLEDISNRKIFESLKNTKTEEKIALDFSDQELNLILYKALKSLNIPGISFEGVSITLEEDNTYDASFSLKASFFPTCIKGKMKLSEDENDLIFSLVNAKIGKIDLTNQLLKKYVFSKIDSTSISNSLNENGLKVTLDFKSLSLKIDKSSLMTFVEKNISSTSLYEVVLETIISNSSIIEYHLGENNKLGGAINLSSLKYIETRDGNISYPLNLESSKEKALNNENINKDNVNALFNYYVSGYNDLDDENKEVIDSLSLSKEEKGIKNHDEIDMTKLISEQLSLSNLSGALASKSLQIEVTENDFNQLLSTQKIIGKSYALYYENDLAYISLDSINIDIKENTADIHVICSLNGCLISINLFLQFDENTASYIDGKLTSISIGNIKVEDKYIPTILEYLQSAINESWISFDATNQIMRIDLTGFISDNELVKALIANNFTCHSSFKEDKLILQYKKI